MEPIKPKARDDISPERKAILQKLFDISARHVIKQGKAAVNPLPKGDLGQFVCVYKSVDGCGCGAAPFIDTYLPEMESHRFEALCAMSRFYPHLNIEAREEYGFVSRLQTAHDGASISASFLTEYRHRMTLVAEQWGGLSLAALEPQS